ncbi:hypothetical protein [Streptomyces huasconensis]|uniref:hypothetical protein n=1 Tax=Streptomyces huasconensis TaxID=1854574 RepID=UPI0033F42251
MTETAARLHQAPAWHAGIPMHPADAAAVLGITERAAEPLLDELAQIHLVERYGSDRYRLPPIVLARLDERQRAMTVECAY